MDLRYPINLIDIDDAEQGDVITRDSEVLGRWHYDTTEFWFTFFADGEVEPTTSGVSARMLCHRIGFWLKERDGDVPAPSEGDSDG